MISSAHKKVAEKCASDFLHATLADDPSLDFARKQVMRATGAIALGVGFRSMHSSSLLLLTSIFERYIKRLCNKSKIYAENDDRSVPSVVDVLQVFKDQQVNLQSLASFVKTPNPARGVLHGVPKFPVALEQVHGWENIPRNFHYNVPLIADVQKEGMLRFLEATGLIPVVDPVEQQRKVQQIGNGKRGFPDFTDMTARVLGFFKPPDEPLITVVSAADSYDDVEMENELHYEEESKIPTSEEVQQLELPVRKKTKRPSKAKGVSKMDKSRETRSGDCAELGGIYLKDFANFYSLDRVPLGPDELCMISNEISPVTNEPTVIIRINRRLMEQCTEAAKKRNDPPAPERARKRAIGRPIAKRRMTREFEEI